ncbi:hypothetical protein C5Y96_17085 [Blastopirellula marina]|uniref:Uncharacterized protein n=1 Tax=Blastopirellula marina TaxID=124 RepID=A0A2S8F7F7_9BACT|nr:MULTISPECIES: hypothetical protein [Pirellulaceae]PQO28086.1 hypothetical protein C5Y96_17085 [Blastopirellula marina]RCS48512.1 hypothetical protein DTL36_17110 [Bremerella cremea]
MTELGSLSIKFDYDPNEAQYFINAEERTITFLVNGQAIVCEYQGTPEQFLAMLDDKIANELSGDKDGFTLKEMSPDTPTNILEIRVALGEIGEEITDIEERMERVWKRFEIPDDPDHVRDFDAELYNIVGDVENIARMTCEMSAKIEKRRKQLEDREET